MLDGVQEKENSMCELRHIGYERCQRGNPDDRADICGEGQQGGKEIS